MDVAEFDRFAEEYRGLHQANVAIVGEPVEFFADYKLRVLSGIAAKHGANAERILDFGSGVGNSIPGFHRFFPDAALTCADLSQASLDVANARFPGLASSLLIETEQLPCPDQAFDMTFSACVFHHIPHGEHGTWLRELHRVTRPGGLLSIFEHNPYNPLTRHAVNTCPFDVNARLIRARTLARRLRAAGWQRPRVRFHLFFPRVLSALRPLEPGLWWLPVGAQYSVTAMRGG